MERYLWETFLNSESHLYFATFHFDAIDPEKKKGGNDGGGRKF